MAIKNNSVIAPSYNPADSRTYGAGLYWSIKPQYNYYLYHWLLTSGEYVFDEENWQFIPNNGKYEKEEIIEQNRMNPVAPENIGIGKMAASWGSSYKTLAHLFSEIDLSHNDSRSEHDSLHLDFSNAIDGDEADFLYLEFDMNKDYIYTLYGLLAEYTPWKESVIDRFILKRNYNADMLLQIRYFDNSGKEQSLTCDFGRGSLLIPMGASAKWLLNDHSEMTMYAFKGGSYVPLPEIKTMKFLKLHGIE